MKTCRIEQWAKTPGPNGMRLRGYIHGHPTVTPDELAYTGTIIEMTDTTAKSKRTEYILGEPERYQQVQPGDTVTLQ